MVVDSPVPVADFVGTPTSGLVPLTVAFTDLSSGPLTSWSWSFGDGASSSLQDPSHVYAAAGTYTVSLTANGPGGSGTETKPGYVVAVEPPIVADFSGTPLSGPAPLSVSFTDLSSGNVTSWAWTFGDGGGSTVQNPNHLYSLPGTYTVSLQATGGGGTDVETKPAYVIAIDTSPAADFTGTPLSGVAPLAVSFTDLSGGNVTSWSWSFGDGGTSLQQHPSHTYTIPGTYTVALTATGPTGTDTLTRTDYVTVATPPPAADFTAAPTTGPAPLIVFFTDASSGPVSSWTWSFGDGSGSTLQSPGHLYASPGSYTVSLSVSGPGGADVETKADFVVVTASPFADGSFEFQTAGAAPGGVWGTTAGGGHVIQPDGGLMTDGAMPTDGLQWADLSTAGTAGALPPSNPGGAGSLPVGAAGIAQSFGMDPTNPVLAFDAAFLLGDSAASGGTNDFMSVDVTDGVTSVNLYYRDTFSSFPDVSFRHGLPMTSVDRVYANLGTLFPAATPATSLTLSIQVGNGGDGLDDSRGYVDGFFFGPPGQVAFRNGSGVNPAVFVAGPPLVGQTWTATFDTSGFPAVTFTFILAYSSPLAGLPTTAGELLVHTGTPLIFQTFAPAGSPHVVNVPPLLGFLGVTGYSQGILFDGSNSFFTNAVDLTMGLALAGPVPQAAFGAAPTSGGAPLTVSFTDQSTGGATTWAWDFGDGGTSSLQNPTHTYVSPGTYDVLLRVTGPGGFDLQNAYGLVTVP